MARTVSVVNLSDEVMGVLNRYVDGIADGTDAAAERAAATCLTEIRSGAAGAFEQHRGPKSYAKQWTRRQTSAGRGKAGYTVYCKQPGLPHLLENGHAKAGGGRVAGRPHIAPAAEKAAGEFQRAVEEVIRGAGD